jgi:hypothetical protein
VLSGEKSAEVIVVGKTSRRGARKSTGKEVSQNNEGLNVKPFPM